MRTTQEYTNEIDFTFCDFTDKVGFVIKTVNCYNTYIYKSPIIFYSIEDANDAAIRDVAGFNI